MPGIEKCDRLLPVCLCEIRKMKQVFDISEGALQLGFLYVDHVRYRIFAAVADDHEFSPHTAARLGSRPIKTIPDLRLHIAKRGLIQSNPGI